MDNVQKIARDQLTSELTEESATDGQKMAEHAKITVPFVASQLRVVITFHPNTDGSLHNLNDACRALFKSIAPLVRDYNISTFPCCSNQLVAMVNRNSAITTSLMNYCTRQKIHKTITEMKKEKQLAIKEDKPVRYIPKYTKIQREFLQNGLHVEWERKLYNWLWWRGTVHEKRKIDQDEKIYLTNMLKEIIICDFEKKDFERKDKNEWIIREGQRGEEGCNWPFSMLHTCPGGYY
jgi:hypothetical protein